MADYRKDMLGFLYRHYVWAGSYVIFIHSESGGKNIQHAMQQSDETKSKI